MEWGVGLAGFYPLCWAIQPDTSASSLLLQNSHPDLRRPIDWPVFFSHGCCSSFRIRRQLFGYHCPCSLPGTIELGCPAVASRLCHKHCFCAQCQRLKAINEFLYLGDNCFFFPSGRYLGRFYCVMPSSLAPNEIRPTFDVQENIIFSNATLFFLLLYL